MKENLHLVVKPASLGLEAQARTAVRRLCRGKRAAGAAAGPAAPAGFPARASWSRGRPAAAVGAA
eukprot:CAMPEP_0194693520 /NCGR_PEP_ID=MMETSP0295-20121207/20603_1 /TAXON_ID=39354 /ORGANISM="Heterosigma akashiwo, Strain CCMP2393" /LENGTH=64 /DNA_ID=CAMNT_0039584463 /DNA_START=45 /DNA_END=235 /DNA_ORIENTATION=+